MAGTYNKKAIEADQAHLLGFYTGDEFEDTDTPQEAFVRSVQDWMRAGGKGTTPYNAIARMARDGQFLIYDEDIGDYLGRTIGGSVKSQGRDQMRDTYIHLMARDGSRLYERTVEEMKRPKPESDVYTMRDWRRDGDFKARSGQQITEEIYRWFLNVLPPRDIPPETLAAYGCAYGFLCGEEACYGPGGAYYSAFGRKSDGTYWYLGLSPRSRKAAAERYAQGPVVSKNRRLPSRFIGSRKGRKVSGNGRGQKRWAQALG